MGQVRVAPFGAVLVDAAGRTLYSLTSEKGGVATCVAACARVWHPLLLTKGQVTAVAGRGVDPEKLSTAEAPNGATYVSYAGWPLYRYRGDTRSKQALGAGIRSFGGTWEPVGADGRLATRH